jgi:hypothetical protein
MVEEIYTEKLGKLEERLAMAVKNIDQHEGWLKNHDDKLSTLQVTHTTKLHELHIDSLQMKNGFVALQGSLHQQINDLSTKIKETTQVVNSLNDMIETSKGKVVQYFTVLCTLIVVGSVFGKEVFMSVFKVLL